MKKVFVTVTCCLLLSALVCPPLSAAGYDPGSPWPAMRHDYLNSGRADDIRPSQMPDRDQVPAWTFRAGGPIFSTPVVGADGTVYIGSADHVFYALGEDGALKWSVRTGTPGSAC